MYHPRFFNISSLTRSQKTIHRSEESSKTLTMNRAGQHPLPVAQYLRLREQIPALYGLLSPNAAILDYTHPSLAPGLLVLTIPAILIATCMIRKLAWRRPVSAQDLDSTHVHPALRRSEERRGGRGCVERWSSECIP